MDKLTYLEIHKKQPRDTEKYGKQKIFDVAKALLFVFLCTFSRLLATFGQLFALLCNKLTLYDTHLTCPHIGTQE
jgi:hypothetical protein